MGIGPLKGVTWFIRHKKCCFPGIFLGYEEITHHGKFFGLVFTIFEEYKIISIMQKYLFKHI